ncbi:MATH domain and coiled-coil domain-containing protein [Senna tora]|uniref:MATH domain and coiled-coil domain-containing protein n=1 Tax=Senna tora TaxID=362788 RepID=A0A834TEL5_9FABA|nr:MATH domain and coiled-coil domain-containing protein [Senna tora]
MGSYESGIFEAAGYKWRLVFYPVGKNKSSTSGANHISLYLRIAEYDTLPLGWEVHVCFKLFVQDQIQDKYLTIQGEAKRFHTMKTEWGFSEFVSMDTFKDPSKGYLVNDSCVFGAEVFAVQCSSKWECFSMIKPPINKNSYTWKIQNFAACKEYLVSPTFEAGGESWKLCFYLNGEGPLKDSFSLFLHLVDLKNLPSKPKVYAKFMLRIRDQQHSNWFKSNDVKYGSKGYIVNDTLMVEVEFRVVSATNGSSQVKQDQD